MFNFKILLNLFKEDCSVVVKASVTYIDSMSSEPTPGNNFKLFSYNASWGRISSVKTALGDLSI